MTRALIERTIQTHGLPDWFQEYPWLIGALGDPMAPVWFIGENPSMRGVISVHKKASEHTENLQWNSHAGDKLLRESITEAGLKVGEPSTNEGWRCFITNVIKAPEVVRTRNANKQRSDYWRRQATIWWPVFQAQVDSGAPKVLICLGHQVSMILRYMISLGLRCPPHEQIHHYSYIMFRPEAGTNREPRHRERIAEFKASIKLIATKYGFRG